MDYRYIASLDVGSESMACCVLRNIEGDMAASLIDLQENGPAVLGDDRGPFLPLLDGGRPSPRLRTRVALVDGRVPSSLPDSHAELALIARPHVPGPDLDRNLFRYFFRDEEDASLGANKWLPNPKVIYQLAAKGYLPEVLDQAGQVAQLDPATLMQHLITQVVRNFVLASTPLGDVDPRDVDLILTLPNVYSLPHSNALSAFVQEHTNVGSVRVVHESDAIAYYASGLVGGLGGMIEDLYRFENASERASFGRLLRNAYLADPAGGVYIVTVDVGRGTTDMSLVHVAWPESEHQYHVLARTGSNKAGNQLSYTFAEYYSAQLRAAYAREGLADAPGLAEHLWDFCTPSEHARTLSPQQGYALDLLQSLIGMVKASLDENYCLDPQACSYGAQRRLTRRIADCIVRHLGGAVDAPPSVLGAPDSAERNRLRDALAEALVLPVGRTLGSLEAPKNSPVAPTNWMADLVGRVTRKRPASRPNGNATDVPNNAPQAPVLDQGAWVRLGQQLRDQAEETPRLLLQNLDKAARTRSFNGNGGAAGGMTAENTLVVLAGQGSQFRPLQSALRAACRSIFGCTDDRILALTGREAKEACCWGALSFVLQSPLHIGATSLHGTYGFLDTGPEGFLPVDMVALNSGRPWQGSFRYPGFRHLIFTPRAVNNIDELGRDYTRIIGFTARDFEVRRTEQGLQVNDREIRLTTEGQSLAEEELLAKLWPEQIGQSGALARKRALPPVQPPPELPAGRGPSKRSLAPHASLLALMLLLAYPAHGLFSRHFTPAAAAVVLPAGTMNMAALPSDDALKPPPDALRASLVDGDGEYTKGSEPASEEELAKALLSLPLHQRLLKVAVATMDDHRMALIKLQAGDTKTGLFRIPDLQADAVNVLRVAFELSLDLQHIDLWSVVPGRDSNGPVHKPVFSLSADRKEFERATSGLKPARDILGGLGLVRFAPQFLQYAGGEQIRDVVRLLPDTAWSAAPVSDNWDELRESCRQDPRLRAAALGRVVVHIPVTDNSVALTIDDGPHPLVTSLFVDILKRYDVHATFFVVGEKAEECPELLRRLVDAGHEIGNHTYSHPRLGQLRDTDALAEIRAGALAIGKVCGKPTPLMRPPGGGLFKDVLRAATAANSTVVLWTHNTNDWLRPSPEEIAANALRDLRPGSIMLMHQGSMESVRALPLIIEGAKARGFQIRPVGEMLRQAPVGVLPITEIMSRYHKHELEKE